MNLGRRYLLFFLDRSQVVSVERSQSSVMTKRAAAGSLQSSRPRKRTFYARDRLSELSDELLLRILSSVPVYSLTACQRVSKRLSILAGDSQLWKAAYYNRFVRPRAARLPGVRSRSSISNRLDYSSKASIWLDEERLVRAGEQTNWKNQYKLSNNWSRGSCDVREIHLASRLSVPPVLARLQKGIIFTVDSLSGLRAWSYKNERKLLAQFNLARSDPAGIPSSLALDSQSDEQNFQRIAIGFEDGHFSIYEFYTSSNTFRLTFRHSTSTNGRLSSLAFAWPYFVSMTESCLLSLYKLSSNSRIYDFDATITARLLISLKAHTVWPPLSISLRTSGQELLVAIAFSVPTYTSGWSVGVQELRMRYDGTMMESRLTSAFDHEYQPLSESNLLNFDSEEEDRKDRYKSGLSSSTHSKPTSLSYSHPYLLVSHSDNTLILYLVTSTASILTISSGKRLWGHTSSVSGAHVAARGKAVSVSTRGNELRIWELEGSTHQSRTRTRQASQSISVQVTSDKTHRTLPSRHELYEATSCRGAYQELGFKDMFDSEIITRGVGFDDENVVVIRESKHDIGSEDLLVYDFT